MSANNTFKIAIIGSGLAATQCALALSRQLPNSVNITLVHTLQTPDSDKLYGTVTSPDAYKNNLALGVSEPELLLNTNSSFSFGSRFVNWGKNKLDWMQCFHLPFPAEAGVLFHHFMTRHKANVNDFLISAQAAQLGRFAHPPEDKPQSALSRAEYGYHFDTQSWSSLFLRKLETSRVNIVQSTISAVNVVDGTIASITTNNGEKVTANLFVDCSGVSASLLTHLAPKFKALRNVTVQTETLDVAQTGPSYRQLAGTNEGWQSITPLQNTNTLLSLNDIPSFSHTPKDKVCAETTANNSFTLGRRVKAWVGNCVGIGHAASVIEPLTPAPYMLLSKDIQRLLELIPIHDAMAMESKEYNRRFNDDLDHAELFHHAMYYKQKDVGYPECSKLERKLVQFSHRGVLANYDLEPFNNEDWVILHWGMGRVPKYYDKLTEQVSESEMSVKLSRMRKGIAHLAEQIPPHHIYLQNFLHYLREKHVSR